MARIVLDLWLDGYETPEDHLEACEEFVYEQLNMTASCVKIISVTENEDAGE